MNQLKKKLQKYEAEIKARKNNLVWQKNQLRSTVLNDITSPAGLSSIFLLSFFLGFSYKKKMIRLPRRFPALNLLSPLYFSFIHPHLVTELISAGVWHKLKISHWLKSWMK